MAGCPNTSGTRAGAAGAAAGASGAGTDAAAGRGTGPRASAAMVGSTVVGAAAAAGAGAAGSAGAAAAPAGAGAARAVVEGAQGAQGASQLIDVARAAICQSSCWRGSSPSAPCSRRRGASAAGAAGAPRGGGVAGASAAGGTLRTGLAGAEPGEEPGAEPLLALSRERRWPSRRACRVAWRCSRRRRASVRASWLALALAPQAPLSDQSRPLRCLKARSSTSWRASASVAAAGSSNTASLQTGLPARREARGLGCQANAAWWRQCSCAPPPSAAWKRRPCIGREG